MTSRQIEFWAMVGNHNLYRGNELVFDWNQHDKGFDTSDVVALCTQEINGRYLFWVESATHEEAEELMSFYK